MLIPINSKTSPSFPVNIRPYIATGNVSVDPDIEPATTTVAPNSLKARTNPINKPARIPRYAKGKVIVKNTLHAPAPNILAHCSSRTSTSAIPTITDLTMRGNETTDEAIAAANQVNTISLPKIIWLNCPSGLELLKIINKKNPIITGGSAKGKETSRSNTKFNGVFRFTNNHPTLRAGIIFISVAIIET